jgi:hypothetical protein
MSETTFKAHQDALYHDLPKYADVMKVLEALLKARTSAPTDFVTLPPNFADRAKVAAETPASLQSPGHRPQPPTIIRPPTIEEALRAAE